MKNLSIDITMNEIRKDLESTGVLNKAERLEFEYKGKNYSLVVDDNDNRILVHNGFEEFI